MIASPLILEKVSLCVKERSLVSALDLTIEPGEIVTLKGPSGCGKSSLLAFISGTLDPSFEASGNVWAGGVELTALRPEHRRIGILFQDALLFPHLSVGDNLAFGLPAEIKGRAARARRVEAALGEAELDGLGDQDPATLSGGQSARVALMRTLLADPAALLLDEPFSKLDAHLRGRMRAFIFGHAKARGLPTLLVTHDVEDAAEAGGPIIDLWNGANS